jgi:pimeloyl-ACP methyl ester carboxylesterase
MWKIGLVVAGLAAALLVFGFVYEKLAEARDDRRFRPPGRLVDVGGRRLHILCKGEAPGPTVVIEQGAGSPSVAWQPLQNEVSAFARVCLYDRAGYQWSDPAPGPRSLSDRAADLHRLLQAGGVSGPYVLVGHSYGGVLNRVFAEAYPQDVAGLVLIDAVEEAAIFRHSYGDYRRGFLQIAAVGRMLARFGVVRLLMTALSRPEGGMTAEMNNQMIGFISRPSFSGGLEDELDSLSRGQAELAPTGRPGALGERPLVVITHVKPFPGPAALLEPGWAEGQKRLAALSTNSELIAATKSNHMIHAEQPELVVDAIRRVHAAATGHTPLAARSPEAVTGRP